MPSGLGASLATAGATLSGATVPAGAGAEEEKNRKKENWSKPQGMAAPAPHWRKVSVLPLT